MSHSTDLLEPTIRHRSFGATLTAVAWSFVGLRRKRDFEVDDAGGLNPRMVVLAGLCGAAIFVGCLLLAVRIALA